MCSWSSSIITSTSTAVSSHCQHPAAIPLLLPSTRCAPGCKRWVWEKEQKERSVWDAWSITGCTGIWVHGRR